MTFIDQYYLDTNGGLHFLSAQDQANALAHGLPLPDPLWTVATAAEVEAVQNPPLTLAQAQGVQIDTINAACQAALTAIIAPYPASEVLTWDQQLAEATAFTASPTASTPLLSAIGAVNGETVADMAASILILSASYKAATGAAIGRRQALTTQISAATTVAAVQAITF